jgi:hypothetical protein
VGLATSDCERVGNGLLAQPVNTWSSLAFLAAGVAIAVLAARSTGRRLELFVFAAAVAAIAAGGLLFHGVQWQASRWVHDVAIVAVLVFIGVFALADILDRPTPWLLAAYGGILGGVAALLAIVPAATDVVSAVLVVAIVAWEILAYRHELPSIRKEGVTARRMARIAVLLALALAATAFLIGRSGGPLCDPGSAFQWHAVWHVLAALAMALYAYGAIEPHPVQVSAA